MASGASHHEKVHFHVLPRAAESTLAAVSAAGLALSATAANAAAPTATSASTWDALAQCESGGNWATNTGNGFSGGLQFTPQTWAGFGGTGSPENASRAQQIAVAEKVQATPGLGRMACLRRQARPERRRWRSCSADPAAERAGPGRTRPGCTRPVQTAPVAQAPVAQVAQAPVQAPVAGPQHAAAVALSGETYTVQAGDTLSKIAEKLGIEGGWQSLADANADTITNPTWCSWARSCSFLPNLGGR